MAMEPINNNVSDSSSHSEGKFMNDIEIENDSNDNIGYVGVVPQAQRLHRKLEARHLSMLALGGALGTGLLIGTGSGLARAGPAPILITYSLMGFVIFLVLGAMGEVATWLPMPSGFTGYATRYVDPAMGFALGYCYWFKYLLGAPTQLTAAALILSYWVPRETVNPGVWIAVFMVAIIAVNLLGIRFFGEVEFYMSVAKIVTLLGVLILSLVLVCGGGPDQKVYGFKTWSNPGAFKPYIQDGNTGRFFAIVSVLVTATFAYMGTELICVTFGEAQNPRRTIPRALRLTFWRIFIFYVLSVLFVGMLVPYNSPLLLAANKHATSASASPFVVAIQVAGIDTLPGIVNGCLFLFVFSTANTDLYIASRTIYGLALEGHAPKILARTTKGGVPLYALGLSSLFGALGFMNVNTSTSTVFTYFTNMLTIFGLLTWISLLVVHLRFVQARRRQGISDKVMAYTAPLGLYGTYFSLAMCIIVAIIKNFSVFVHSSAVGGNYGNFDWKNFITGYLGIPVYFIFFVGYKIWFKTKLVESSEVDFYLGRQQIDDEENEFLALQEKEREEGVNQPGKFYKYISWLF